jgi:hypothetical protein
MATSVDESPYLKVTTDLDLVVCKVLNASYGNISHGDAFEFEKRLTDETVKNIVDKNGVQCIAGDLGGRGATGPGPLDIVKILWENKEVISAVLAAFKAIPKLLKYPINQSYKKYQQSMTLELTIHSDHKYDARDSFQKIANRLMSVKYIAEQEVLRLRKQYPAYQFNQLVVLDLPRNSFKAEYYLCGDQDKKFYDKRIIYAMSGLQLVQGLRLNISIAKTGLLKHAIEILVTTDGRSWKFLTKKPKIFYSYMSRRMAGGYFWKYQRMTDAEFVKFVEKAESILK